MNQGSCILVFLFFSLPLFWIMRWLGTGFLFCFLWANVILMIMMEVWIKMKS